MAILSQVNATTATINGELRENGRNVINIFQKILLNKRNQVYFCIPQGYVGVMDGNGGYLQVVIPKGSYEKASALDTSITSTAPYIRILCNENSTGSSSTSGYITQANAFQTSAASNYFSDNHTPTRSITNASLKRLLPGKYCILCMRAMSTTTKSAYISNFGYIIGRIVLVKCDMF